MLYSVNYVALYKFCLVLLFCLLLLQNLEILKQLLDLCILFLLFVFFLPENPNDTVCRRRMSAHLFVTLKT